MRVDVVERMFTRHIAVHLTGWQNMGVLRTARYVVQSVDCMDSQWVCWVVVVHIADAQGCVVVQFQIG